MYCFRVDLREKRKRREILEGLPEGKVERGGGKKGELSISDEFWSGHRQSLVVAVIVCRAATRQRHIRNPNNNLQDHERDF